MLNTSQRGTPIYGFDKGTYKEKRTRRQQSAQTKRLVYKEEMNLGANFLRYALFCSRLLCACPTQRNTMLWCLYSAMFSLSVAQSHGMLFKVGQLGMCLCRNGGTVMIPMWSWLGVGVECDTWLPVSTRLVFYLCSEP